MEDWASNQAVALDPLNGRNYRIKTEVLLFARRYANAIEAGRKAVQLSPLSNARIMIGDALLLLGRVPKRRPNMKRSQRIIPFGQRDWPFCSREPGTALERCGLSRR